MVPEGFRRARVERTARNRDPRAPVTRHPLTSAGAAPARFRRGYGPETAGNRYSGHYEPLNRGRNFDVSAGRSAPAADLPRPFRRAVSAVPRQQPNGPPTVSGDEIPVRRDRRPGDPGLPGGAVAGAVLSHPGVPRRSLP